MLLLNCNILFTSDPTLTIDTVMAVTDGVDMPEYGDYLDIPYYTYEAIIKRNGTGQSGRRALFADFLSHHPYPRWELVVELLEELEYKGMARAGLAQEVKEKYLTSE